MRFFLSRISIIKNNFFFGQGVRQSEREREKGSIYDLN